ncbi:MAG: tryptophan--tRNA ligase [Anaerolineales bacterium]|nr:tryptophan--tRNA ligase [Anaerolineales bacterium]
MSQKRILTGDRPTGRLHLGHYLGSLKNRVMAQDQYQCYFIIADLHTLTTRPHKHQIAELSNNIHQMVLDYLAVGIDPTGATIFVQSAIPQIYALNTLLGMLAAVPRLERIPSLKEMAEAADLKTVPLGLLGYPVLMSADILLPRAHLVPVGADNQAHVELARELARRFNHMYGETFPVPDYQIEDTLIGTDGQAKMSKSLNNAIFLSDSPRTVEQKVMGMYTDPRRISADIPGQVEGNPVFIYHEAFNPDQAEAQDLKARYRQGKVGDVEVKRKLGRAINHLLDPIRERRAQFERQPDLVTEILAQGNRRMQIVAQETMAQVMNAMGMTSYTPPGQDSVPAYKFESPTSRLVFV